MHPQGLWYNVRGRSKSMSGLIKATCANALLVSMTFFGISDSRADVLIDTRLEQKFQSNLAKYTQKNTIQNALEGIFGLTFDQDLNFVSLGFMDQLIIKDANAFNTSYVELLRAQYRNIPDRTHHESPEF